MTTPSAAVPTYPRRHLETALPEVQLRLMNGFDLVAGSVSIALPHDARRLVALLALKHRQLPRVYVAGKLWMDGSQDRAFGNLRSALWRLRRITDTLVEAGNQTLRLAPARALRSPRQGTLGAWNLNWAALRSTRARSR